MRQGTPQKEGGSKEILYPTFGAVLRRAMKSHGWKSADLARQLGCSMSHLSEMRMGKMMPNEHRTAMLAELLDAPSLVTIREAVRSAKCDECGLVFARPAQWLRRARFCSGRCRGRWWSRITNAEKAAHREASAPRTIMSLKRQRRELVADLQQTREDLAIVRAAVAAFCWSCEPAGVCHDPTSPLRAVSPLPLAKERVA